MVSIKEAIKCSRVSVFKKEQTNTQFNRRSFLFLLEDKRCVQYTSTEIENKLAIVIVAIVKTSHDRVLRRFDGVTRGWRWERSCKDSFNDYKYSCEIYIIIINNLYKGVYIFIMV